MIKKVLMILGIGFFVTGCSVKPAKIAYNEPAKNQRLSVYSVIVQDELDALYPIQNSSAVSSQFGLVGALIGSAIDASANTTSATKAEENLAGIRNELIDLDFDKIFEEEIIKKLKDNVNVDGVTTLKSLNQVAQGVDVDDSYLILNTYYKMDMDFRTPFIVTEVSINTRAKGKRRSRDEVLYKNTFTYYGTSLPVPVKDIDPELAAANIKKIKDEWRAKPRNYRENAIKKNKYKKELREAKAALDPKLSFDEANALSTKTWSNEYKGQLEINLRSGIQTLFTLIANDIRDKTDPKTYKKLGRTPEGYPVHHKSMLVEENDKNKVIRFTNGHRAGAICSMPVKGNEDKLVCI